MVDLIMSSILQQRYIRGQSNLHLECFIIVAACCLPHFKSYSRSLQLQGKIFQGEIIPTLSTFGDGLSIFSAFPLFFETCLLQKVHGTELQPAKVKRL